MLYQFLLYVTMTQSTPPTRFFSCIIYHHVLSQEIGYSFLPYAVGPHCLSIPHVIVCIYKPQTPSPSLLLLLGNHKSVLYVCESVSVSYISDIIWYLSFSLFFLHFILWLHSLPMEVLGPEIESKPLLQPTPLPDPLIHCARLGIESTLLQRPELLQSDSSPTVPRWELLSFSF